MQQIFLVGRVIVGAYYLFNAFNHFTHLPMLTRLVAAKHVPSPEVAVIVSGLLLAIAGVSLLLGVVPRVGVAAAVLFLLPVSLIMHAFWNDTGATARMADMINFTKNMALLGSTLMFVAIPEPWSYSVRAPVVRRHLRAPLSAR